MELVRQVVVFDAADLETESTFWAGMLGGRVFRDPTWHGVIDAHGRWVIGVQLAPDHVPPLGQMESRRVISIYTSMTRLPPTPKRSGWARVWWTMTPGRHKSAGWPGGM